MQARTLHCGSCMIGVAGGTCRAAITRCQRNMDAEEVSQLKTAFISAVIVLNITLNVLVIAIIVKYPQLREDRTTLFMLSLTVSDLANGCTVMPVSAAVCSDATPNVRNMTRYLPKILLFCSMWFNLNSIHSLCWVTVYKMIAITKPLRCEQILTRNRCYYIICGNWLIGVIFATALFRLDLKWNLDTCIYSFQTTSHISAVVGVGLVVGFVLPVITMVYATASIFRAIVRTHLQITSQVNSLVGGRVANGNTSSLTLKSLRSGRNVLLMCLSYVILTIPLCVHVVADVIGGKDRLPPSFQLWQSGFLLVILP